MGDYKVLSRFCHPQRVLVCTPRRFGKTWAVAMFIAALIYCVPNMWISVFSTGQRASSSLLDLTHKFVCSLKDGSKRVKKKNQEVRFALLLYNIQASPPVRVIGSVGFPLAFSQNHAASSSLALLGEE